MKSMKKLVLAGLILLASVMVLVGCKNDSVPEVPKAKLISISITPPTRTAYSEGDIFDDTGMVVTATYSDGESQKVTGWSTNFADVTGARGLNKPITVSYTEGDVETTDTFTVDVASYQFTETVQNYEYPEGKTGTASVNSSPAVATPLYKIFGDWPQTIMGAGVTVGSGTLVRGGLSYHVGSDGNYYVEAEERAYGSGSEYKYSDRTQVGQDGASKKWFKVEPIVWRVLTEDYKVPGENGEPQSTEKALLLAENILTGGIKWADSTNNYMESNIRKWLNGNNGDAGFLQTAFTETARDQIADTKVDNSVTSTLPNTLTEEQKSGSWNNGENEYACGDTTDKIFLLSEQEATKSDYGFAVYQESGQGNTRIRVTTDYAKATGAYQDSTAGYGGWWWLRSPYYGNESDARFIYDYGSAISHSSVADVRGGVVPALCIKVQ